MLHRFPLLDNGNTGDVCVLDTVIIGAGFAGLSAARALMAEGRGDFVVLEARDRVGGRTKPGKIGDISIDLGGMWMAPSQTRLKSLTDHYRVRNYPTHLDGNAIFRIGNRERLGPREDISRLLEADPKLVELIQ